MSDVETKSKIENVKKNIHARNIATKTDYSVAMANDMIRGCSKLSLNELKLVRLMIMQINPEDTELFCYKIHVKELAEILGIKPQHIYKKADEMTDHLMGEIIRIGDGNPKHKWKKFQWVSDSEYDNGIITIQLHEKLKPYLVGLQKWYTTYKLENIVNLKSVYSIRLYELIVMALKGEKYFADNKATVYIDLETIRKATNTEEKYKQIGIFKRRVISASINELQTKLDNLHITVRDYKVGRKIEGFYFDIETDIGFKYREMTEKRQQEQDNEIQQLDITDFL